VAEAQAAYRRIDFIPRRRSPSMTLQWQDEVGAKFGLSFQIIDRERLRGFSVGSGLATEAIGRRRAVQPLHGSGPRLALRAMQP
jgi:hypothetical protein